MGKIGHRALQCRSTSVLKSDLCHYKRTLSRRYSAEDGVFAFFYSQIGVEYEERQRLRFDQQASRLTHQSQFEEEQLKLTLRNTAEDEQWKVAELGDRKRTIQVEITDAQETHAKAAKILDQALEEIGLKNDQIEKLVLERSATYRNIKLPLLEGNLRKVPMEENLREEDVDDDDGTQRPRQVQDYVIEVDFDSLTEEECADNSPETTAEFDAEIAKLSGDIERMALTMKATEKLNDVEAKLADTEKMLIKCKKTQNPHDQFNDVKRKRCELFNIAYNHISDCVDQVYKDLTRGKASPMGGVAYLSLEDGEEPYNAGIKRHAMPPMKRFRDNNSRAGRRPWLLWLYPLRYTDAALGNTNFIVISLQGFLYERGNSLVGIYRDQDVNSSRTLMLDPQNAAPNENFDNPPRLCGYIYIPFLLAYPHFCLVLTSAPHLFHVHVQMTSWFSCPHASALNITPTKIFNLFNT
ncbi:hypothetical protein P692DRAFT_20869318 [Suillus brevipes Sb2]|nr:hypothetical protein P692DRAFT_20869318 [Suillus brevipes Sb2]